MSARAITIGVIGLAVAVAAAAGNPGIRPRAVLALQATPTQAVTIDTFQFKPRDLEIREGTKVVWTNEDDVQHTVTSGTPEGRTELFNTLLNGKGARFEFTFAQAGTYRYFCNRHQHMRGEIVVKAL